MQDESFKRRQSSESYKAAVLGSTTHKYAIDTHFGILLWWTENYISWGMSNNDVVRSCIDLLTEWTEGVML